MNEPIPLSQKIYLLGIHPQKGGVISAANTAMDYVLLGTLFLELYQNKNISFEKKRIVLKNKKTEIPLHNFLIQKLKKSKRDLKISRWMNRLYFSLKYIRGEVQQGLVNKQIIKVKHKRFLFLKWNSPVIVNKQALYHLLSEIENHILKGTVNEEEIMLLSFLEPAGLMKRLFPEKEKRKIASRKLKNIMDENPVSDAVADAISASQAVAASVAVSTAATVAATS
ncbi:GOLPH3/VPS74 family protein [Maribellus maritimus]|uniref:GOLPH3/VPS74 family protein n=1 Tax=Maribellus maritimus TaxID=2870838 RepID=UPI001EEBFA7A|nr:GPP34 family phosphoprotein [Maribellus maritimus]MCG6186426.1 GPP34 family phosphoprotein [Maribellus maritimus]